MNFQLETGDELSIGDGSANTSAYRVHRTTGFASDGLRRRPGCSRPPRTSSTPRFQPPIPPENLRQLRIYGCGDQRCAMAAYPHRSGEIRRLPHGPLRSASRLFTWVKARAERRADPPARSGRKSCATTPQEPQSTLYSRVRILAPPCSSCWFRWISRPPPPGWQPAADGDETTANLPWEMLGRWQVR